MYFLELFLVLYVKEEMGDFIMLVSKFNTLLNFSFKTDIFLFIATYKF